MAPTLLALPLLCLSLILSPAPALGQGLNQELTRDRWRSEVAATRQLAERNVPEARRIALRLQAEHPKDISATNQVRILNLLARIEHYAANMELSADYIEQALEIAIANNDHAGQAEAYLTQVLNFVHEGNIAAMIDAINSSMMLLEGIDRPDLVAEAMLRTSGMYRRLGQLDDSVAMAVQTMEFASASGNAYALALAHQGMAITFDLSEQAETALHHYRQMREYARQAGSVMLEGAALLAMGEYHVSSGDIPAGEEAIRQTIAMYHSMGAPFGESRATFALTSSLIQQARYRDALPLINKVIDISHVHASRLSEWWALSARSEIREALGQPEAAWQDAQLMQQLAKEVSVPFYYIQSTQRLAKLAADRNDFRSAYELSAEAARASNRSEREQSSERVIELAERYQSQSRQRQVEALMRANERHSAQMRLLWLGFGSTLIILLGSQLFLLRLRRSHHLLEVSNTELQIARNEQKAIIDAIPDLMFEMDLSGRYLASYVSNPELLLASPDELQGQRVQDVMDDEAASTCLAALQEAHETGVSMGAQIQLNFGKRRNLWFELSIARKSGEPEEDPRFIVLSRNITERKNQQIQKAARLKVFERLAEGGELSDILDLIVECIEQQFPDLLVSIMLPDESGQHLITAAAPSLPTNFIKALDGLKISEGEGSCGTAVWRGEAVIAEDIQTHPFWDSFKRLALEAGLISCWSEPIIGSSGQVLGVFGIYRREPGTPEEVVKGSIYRETHIAAIAIERSQMEKALRDSEREFRALAENAPVNIARYDADCRLLYANPEMITTIGHPADEVYGKTPTEASCESGSFEYQSLLNTVLATGEPRDMEVAMESTENNSMIYHHILLVPEHDTHGIINGVLAIGSDISKLKQAEQHLKHSEDQLRSLATRLETTREEERRRIARELHDEMGQLLTAIRMEISILKLRYSLDDPHFQHKIQSIVELVDKTIRGVRNVVVMLRPAALERGIIDALEWLVDEFSRRTGISCKLDISNRQINLDEDYSITLFRIAQESLTNVARHADADSVKILLQHNGTTCSLQISDNGTGFDPSVLKSHSSGLIGIRERVLRLDGKMRLDTAPGCGTTLEINIPLHNTETAGIDN
ncbi:PAS domain-containing protein [Nitrincola sp. MINF-07-Sa-05]|uniref:PAS domain-containing protein n=1 Tax=Nitrincola salilacus TaxID=3400273 RepID=UPI00391841D2